MNSSATFELEATPAEAKGAVAVALHAVVLPSSPKPYYNESGITLYHGDCLEILPLFGGVECVVTDPPYGTKIDRDGYGRRQNNRATNGKVGVHIAGDEDLTAFEKMLASANPQLLCTFGSPKKSAEMLAVINAAGLSVTAEIVWDKNIPGLGGGIRYQHENIYIATRSKFEGNGQLFSVMRETSVSRGGEHPHEKPTALVGKLLCYMGRTLVCDPFAGSGTTLRAAKDLGWQAIGIEVNEAYCEIAARRMSQGVLWRQNAGIEACGVEAPHRKTK